jgi:hypothetical protein
MRRSVQFLMACCAIAPTIAVADSDGADVGRDVGAVLAWRLGPEFVEEKCRDVDPDGAEARKTALASWLARNAAVIKTVDERVAEVVPLAFPSPDPEKRIAAVREKVKQILLETISAEGDAEQLKAACKGEANPASPRWSLNGVPQVQNSLAALYDWKVQKEKK